MERLISDDDLISKIDNLTETDHIIMEIWDYEHCVAKLVVTAQIGNIAYLTNTFVFQVCQFNLDNDLVSDIKKEGYRLKRELKRRFSDKKVTSNFRYS